jgi:osmoprotectant transport system permease protein
VTAAPGAASQEPVIPDFGEGSDCVTRDSLFCWDWVRDNWADTLQPKLIDHVELTLIAVGVGFVLAFGLALLAHRFGALDNPIGIGAALIYTIPSLAIFQILIPYFGLSTTTIEIALVGYSLVILYPNIIAGLRSAPPEVLEAARGMGLEPGQVLTRVELPLALPAIIGGLRIAVVSTVSIATIAAFLGSRGLGHPIFVALQQPTPFKTEIYAAGALVVGLALVCDFLLVALRRVLVPWARVRA